MSLKDVSLHNKYHLKQSIKTLPAKQICIHCGKKREVFYSSESKSFLPRPNTNMKILKGIGPTPGSFLGCILGLHDFYFEWELRR